MAENENKVKISVAIHPKLLERVDAVAEARGQSRSEVIDRILGNGIKSEEATVKDMEDPIQRAIISLLFNSPTVISGLAKLVGRNLTPEQIEETKQNMNKGIQRAKERQAAKRRKQGETQQGGLPKEAM